MTTDSGPEPIPLQDIVTEGKSIAAVLLVWGGLATVARYGVANIGVARPGELFFEFGNALAALFVVTGLACVLIYAIARGIQLSRP